MIDNDGFRLNVGIIIANQHGKLFLAKRINQDAWQFPQGGVNKGEHADDALFREIEEEVGLTRNDVSIIGCTRHWLRYKLPKKMIRDVSPTCIGQKQKWYLVDFHSDDSAFSFDRSDKPVFDGWQWVNYWYPLHQVISFKREVYRKALKELAPLFWKYTAKRSRNQPLQHILDW